MKRFIALILSLSICLSVAAFVPTASAEDIEPTVYNFIADGTTLKKTEPINPTAAKWYSINTRNWKGFDVSDNIKEFISKYNASEITSWTFDNNVTYTNADVIATLTDPYNSLDGIRIRILRGQAGGLVFSPSVKYGDKKVNGVNQVNIQANFKDSWIALKLDAPQTKGKHDLTFNWVASGSGTYADDCDVYFAPYEDGKNDGDYYIENAKNMVASGLSLSNTASPTTTIEGIEIGDSAQYILVIKLNGVRNSNKLFLEKITLTKTEDETAPEEAPTEVNYGVFDNMADADAVTVSGGSDNKLFGAVEAGTEIKATAGDKDGYKFRYWVLGSVATGRYYSSEKTVTVKPYANISLTAIYTTAEEGKSYLDFFNYNGEFIDSKEVIDGKVSALPGTPTLTGYSFTNWILEDKKTTFKTAEELTVPAGVAGVVAQYDAIGGYDTAIENKNSESGWMRNGKLVTYSADYTFYKWLTDAGTIEKNTDEITEKTPIAILEKSGASFMLEYDKGAFEIKEVGILFGKTESVAVSSAYSKAIAMRYEEDGHGQLTATPNGDENMELYARGYVMYGDKVIYTDAIAVK